MIVAGIDLNWSLIFDVAIGVVVAWVAITVATLALGRGRSKP